MHSRYQQPKLTQKRKNYVHLERKKVDQGRLHKERKPNQCLCSVNQEAMKKDFSAEEMAFAKAKRFKTVIIRGTQSSFYY